MTWILQLFGVGLALAAPSAPAAKEKPTVIVHQLAIEEDLKRILVPVKVEAKVRSQVTAEAEGWVTKVLKPLGAKVKRGDAVLVIENKDPTYTYAAVKVRSPVNGIISSFDLGLMSKVSRGDKLFSVIEPTQMKLSAEIPGGDIQLLKPNTLGAFRTDLSSTEVSEVKLIGVSPLVDPRTGTASAEMEFLKKEKLPAIGTVGHVLFEISKGKVLLVPESAIGFADGNANVRVISADGHVTRKNVEIGEQKESDVVIKSGIKEGEKIVLRSSRPLKDGEAVQVESSETK
jgi:multidrug efflux pump subunit AcrA (membrane-fusion protein)